MDPRFASPAHSMPLSSHHTTQAVDAMHHAQYLPSYSHQPAPMSYHIPLPNGMDSDLDFRSAFYSYIPHEVKHRKRTTRAQLKLLESTYAKDPKPVASVRKSLALQLEMTARAVQVWFQNRRAKDKQLAKKAKAAAEQQQTLVTPGESPIATDHEENDATLIDSPQDVSPDSANDESAGIHSAFAFAKRAGGPVPSGLGISQTSWSGPASAQPRSAPQTTPPPSEEYLSLRRGSLPIIAAPRASTPGSLRPMDAALGRRRSLEPTQSRLSGHPYAAAVQPPQILPPSLPFISQMRSSSAQAHAAPSAEDPNGAYRPPMMHRASVPNIMPQQPTQRLISSPPYRNLPAFAFPPRVVSAPLPGPLPAADFSFGAPADQPHQQAQHQEAPPHQAEDRQEEIPYDSGSYSRYGSIASLAESDLSNASEFSRFGSIASATGSEMTSASGHTYGVESYGGLQLQGMEKDGASYEPEMRRPSATGEQFVEMFSTLGVEGGSPHGSNGSGSLTYPSPEGYSWAQDQAIGQLEYNLQQQAEGERTTPTGPVATIPKSQLTVSTGMYGLSGYSPQDGMSSLPSATSSVSSLGLPLDCSPRGALPAAYYSHNGVPHDFTTPTNASAAANGDMEIHIPTATYVDMQQQHHYVSHQNVAEQAYLASYAPHHLTQMIPEPVSSLTAALTAPGEESYYS